VFLTGTLFFAPRGVFHVFVTLLYVRKNKAQSNKRQEDIVLFVKEKMVAYKEVIYLFIK